MQRSIQPERDLRRAASFEDAYDADSRTLKLSFASETPVRRWYGWEVLSCRASDVDLSRMAKGAPLLRNHDPDQHIGVMVSATCEGGRVIGRARLSKRATDVADDIADGILSNVSVGYETTDVISDEKNDAGERVIRWAWKPYEVSLVSVPADETVGIGRSAGGQETKETHMSEKNETAPAAVEVKAEVKVHDIKREAAEIVALGRKHGADELASRALVENWDIAKFRSELLGEIAKRAPAAVKPESAEIGMSEKEKRQFSFIRAIRSQLPGDHVDAGLEIEASRAVAKKLGRDPRGLFIPFDVQTGGKRDLQIGGGGTGANVVATNLLAGSFIEALRNATILDRVGCTFLTGLVGDIALPKQTAAATAYWVAEGVAPTESQLTLGQVTGTPHSLGANTDITRKLLMQSSVDVEGLVRNDLAAVLARGIDTACFADGGVGAPDYLLGVSGINNPSINSAGSATYAEILGFPSAVAADNVDTTGGRFVATNEVFYNLCARPRDTNAASFIASPDNNTIIGMPCLRSESLPANTLVFGVWSNLIVAMWGNGLDLVVDPYTQSKAGIVQVTAFMDVDFLPRHAQAFAYNTAVTA